MTNLDDFRLYLPKYLSPDAEQDLFEDLKNFPQNPKQFYTNYRQNDPVVYQGDGIKDLLIINLPKPEIRPSNAMVISNTCDINLENKRPIDSRVCYTPIFNLRKYRDVLLEKWSSDTTKVENHINCIRRQEISQIFYLPVGGGLSEDSFIFLDRISNCDNASIDRTKLKDIRIFTLGNSGFYVFCFKLSLHFTRINEKVDRDELIFNI